MPTIALHHHDLEQLTGRKIELDQLAELLELVKGELKSTAPDSDELRVELNDTNRPDLWCVEGIARQLRFKLNPQDTPYNFFSKKTEATHHVQVEASVREVRPLIGGFIVKGVKVNEPLLLQLIQTQEKLCENYGQKRRSFAIGVYPLKDIVFPLRYSAVAPDELTFVPLGAEEEMSLRKILSEHPKGKEYAHLLEGLSRYPIIRDSTGGVLSFPPIINSKHLGEVSCGDSDLFVEATGFSLEPLALALNILAYNLADRGAEILPVSVSYDFECSWSQQLNFPYKLDNSVRLPLEEFSRLSGEKLSTEDITKHLNAYGCSIAVSGNEICVSTESYRLDYLHPVDAIEDYLISRGYSSFEVEAPKDFTVGAVSPITTFSDYVRRTVAGFSFEEVISNVLMSKEEVTTKTPGLEPSVEIENVMIETYAVVRSSLIPGLLKLEAASQKALYPHRVFEVGEVVSFNPENTLGCDTWTACTLLLSHAESNFSELHGYLDHLIYHLDLEYELQPAQSELFMQGRAGKILIAGKSYGMIGELAPQVLDNWGIRTPCAAFELNLTALLPLCTNEKTDQP
ncbi:MAG: phenylalanine--tRNA ligase subunit beta [Deltaproteobacteria bacterium]|nr:phenylalanine--tRNA ligase subunit beta [Deltaproteobacteria bacterium]